MTPPQMNTMGNAVGKPAAIFMPAERRTIWFYTSQRSRKNRSAIWYENIDWICVILLVVPSVWKNQKVQPFAQTLRPFLLWDLSDTLPVYWLQHFCYQKVWLWFLGHRNRTVADGRIQCRTALFVTIGQAFTWSERCTAGLRNGWWSQIVEGPVTTDYYDDRYWSEWIALESKTKSALWRFNVSIIGNFWGPQCKVAGYVFC